MHSEQTFAISRTASGALAADDRPQLNPARVYLASLGNDLSRRSMITSLNRAASIIDPSLAGSDAWSGIPWERLNAASVRAVMAKATGSPATRNKVLAALKGVARSAWETRQLDTEELLRIRSIKGDCGSRELAGRFVPLGEVTALLLACAADKSAAGARDAAMFSIALSTGARRAELASISLENIESVESEGRYQIRIIGKRNKERTLYVSGNAGRAVADWLAIRTAPGCNCGPLFCAIRKGGTVLKENGLTTTALDKLLIKRSRAAGLTAVTYHDFRRTTASNLLDAGADIAVVAGILGHSNVQTTARYDRRGERARVSASEMLSVPYFKR
jgi:site-specific recombinase XerD